MEPGENKPTHKENKSIPKPAPVAEQPIRIGQFRITTLLSWTAVICVLMATLGAELYRSSGGAIILLVFFAPALCCIPMLVDQLLHKEQGVRFSVIRQSALIICVGIYSMLMLMLATTAFGAIWKGSKGLHWFYYTLDSTAGMTLWPTYAIGVGLFILAMVNPVQAKRNPIFLLGVGTCAAISIWYTFATLVLNFTNNEGKVMAIVPGSTGLAYCLYCIIIWRNREFTWADVKAKWLVIVGWFCGLFAMLVAKIPLAIQYYNQLADERPEDCFIVTAATRGHRKWVGAWFDEEHNRLLNEQLLTFWKLEGWLKSHVPRTHRLIRRIYNRLGPVVARSIVFRWQADLVYLLLKPVEFLSRLFVR